MLNAKYIFKLKPWSVVETEGGPVDAVSVAGTDYTRGDYFNGGWAETYMIETPNGGFTVLRGSVEEIIEA